MEQQVYNTGYGIRLVPQNPDEQQQQQQQQQNFIMADDQHLVYSPIKPNELSQAQVQNQHQSQYITQDDSISNQYIIQQSPGQVFYANISPTNQNSNRVVQQTVALNHGLIQQQNPPKVI